jgi:hypothetical protein
VGRGVYAGLVVTGQRRGCCDQYAQDDDGHLVGQPSRFGQPITEYPGNCADDHGQDRDYRFVHRHVIRYLGAR